jgi:uncharacterized linocin/CFP29 family protein
VNHLHRQLAPISDAAWAEIEEEASQTLRHTLAGRKLVDFTGPLGWETGSVRTGRTDDLGEGPIGGVRARLRRVQPLVELRTPFSVSRRALDAIDRGACDADLDPVRFAARSAALAEDKAVFHGFPAAGIEGVIEASPHEAITIDEDYERYPSFVAQAMARLQDAGVTGPYAIGLGPRCYTGVVEQSEMGGYPVLKHLELILGGPVVRAPGVNGAVVVSMRGGDIEIICGQDFSIGYSSHDADHVELYLEESITVQVCAPEAAIHLGYAD